MLPPNARKWIAALRSGEFKQGKGSLRLREGNEDRYCCLGVAAEICRRDNPDLIIWQAIGDRYEYHISHGGITSYHGYLDPEVEGWLGFLDHQIQFSFGDMNDAGKTFEEIAQHIEDHAGELFDGDPSSK